AHLNGGCKAGWINRFCGGSKYRIDSDVFQGGGILCLTTRIGCKILCRCELFRIDENGNNRPVGCRLRSLHESEMPGVKCPHGWNESDSFSVFPPCPHAGGYGFRSAVEGNAGRGVCHDVRLYSPDRRNATDVLLRPDPLLPLRV